MRDRKFVNGTFSDPELTRKNNGYFGQPGTPRQTHVSGALLLPDPNFFHLDNKKRQPLLIKNPFVKNPLPDDIFPVNEMKYDVDEDAFRMLEGRNIAALLGLSGQ